MDQCGIDIYNELSAILDNVLNEFSDDSKQTFSNLANSFNEINGVKIMPPYNDFVESICHSAYLHTLDTISAALSDVCENLAEQISFNYSHFDDKYAELEQKIYELEDKINSK